MKRVFLDSSVLFSATYSRRGHSHDLILMAARGEIRLIVSQLVLAETARNLSENAPPKLILFEGIVETINFELVDPDKEDVMEAAKRTALKDAPIIAAAKTAKVDMLVTLDKKHLLGRPELASYIAAEIVTPREAFQRLSS